MTPRELRRKIRNGEFLDPTSGQCPGYVQANLAIMPARYAEDFAEFCRQNQKACPVLAVSKPGSGKLPELGDDLDIRTDVSGFVCFKHGAFDSEHQSLLEVWQEDLVTFAIGCSFSFDYLLVSAGLPVRHNEMGVVSPVYVTNVLNKQSGPFAGELVVSMRPMSTSQTIQAIEITSRHPHVHGAPVHFGDPKSIGIADVKSPDFGGPVLIHEHELPVFWACGVTPQRAIMSARLPIAFAHKPGHMLVTDLRIEEHIAHERLNTKLG